MIGSFGRGASRDYVLRLTGTAPFPTGIAETHAGAAAEDAMRRLGYMELIVNPPDVPGFFLSGPSDPATGAELKFID